MRKLLVICGQTATGKTSLALKLAKKFNGEIISADSRQVYRGMDIGTGKDLPKGAKIKYPWFSKYGFYEIEGARIWGYDLADPRRDFSVARYIKFADKIINDIEGRKKLPILVGGTGLYIKGVIDRIPTASVPQNRSLREKLSKKTAEELYEMLSQMDAIKAASLNSSDKKNPRRLMRAIEVAQWDLQHGGHLTPDSRFRISGSVLFVGLTAPKDFLEKMIETRVKERMKMGIKDEIRKLLRMGVAWEDQSMVAMGYGQWRDFFEGGVGEEEVVAGWVRAEKNYAKRQITWFKKDKRIEWFDITSADYPKNVEKLAEKWYILG